MTEPQLKGRADALWEWTVTLHEHGITKPPAAFREGEPVVRPKRPYIDPAWCAEIIAAPLHREEQPDGRVRFWGEDGLNVDLDAAGNVSQLIHGAMKTEPEDLDDRRRVCRVNR